MTITAAATKGTFWQGDSGWADRWTDTALPRRVDVAVVGGGLAGLAVADELVRLRPYASIAVFEAVRIGFGASGRNAGFLSPLPLPTWLLGVARCDDHAWASAQVNREVHALAARIASDLTSAAICPTPLRLEGSGRLWSSALGALIGGSILIVPYLMGGIGGGDVKLLAAMGAWLQSRSLLLAFGVGGLLIGTVALVRLCRRRSLQRSTILSLQIAKSQLLSLGRSLALDDRVEDVVRRDDRHERLIPFGVCFAIALCLLVGWRLIQH